MVEKMAWSSLRTQKQCPDCQSKTQENDLEGEVPVDCLRRRTVLDTADMTMYHPSGPSPTTSE